MLDDEPAVVGGRAGLRRPGRRRATPRGLVASLRVEPYATGTVLPHERTHAGPKEGRLRLLRAARAQLEPIFLLYDGEPPVAPPEREPDLAAADTRLWRLAGRGRLRGVRRSAAPDRRRAPPLRDRRRLRGRGRGRPRARRMMVVLVSTSDPGLEIFPTHRLFRGHDGALPPAGVGDSATPAAAVRHLRHLALRPGPRGRIPERDDLPRHRRGGRARRRARRSAHRARGDRATRPTSPMRSHASTRVSSTVRSCCARPASRTCSSARGGARSCLRRRRTSSPS